VIPRDQRFFEITKKLHNGLQGATEDLTDAERELYLATSKRNAERLVLDYDFIFLHDPQPAAIRQMRGKGSAAWVWRCHIDTSTPNPAVWAFLRPFLEPFDAAVFTLPSFVLPDLPVQRVKIVPPAIDPLSPKNMPLSDTTARSVLEWIGMDLTRPLITQVSRFDPWKDPLGVIDAYHLIRTAVPDVQLALVGSMASDDPEGWEIYHRVEKIVHDDPAVHVFTNLTGVGNIEVNAFQRLSQVVIQKSTREGFRLVVSEALWKNTPVVAGRAGGIPLQLGDELKDYLVDSIEGCAEAVTSLLRDRERARDAGRRGQARVRENFLTPRLVLDEIDLMRDLSAYAASSPESGRLTATNSP
jgi:trehalose synthase